MSEQRIEALGSNLLAYHGDYHVNDDGWTVCICGHVAEGDDDDGSHARHVAKEVLGSAWFMESLASVWTEADAALRERLFNSYSHGDERGELGCHGSGSCFAVFGISRSPTHTPERD